MALSLACVAYEGDDYLLVLDGDRVVSPQAVERLAFRRVGRAALTRRFRFMLVDESVPAARGGNRPFAVRGFTWGPHLPVEVDCGGFWHAVGEVERLEHRAPGASHGTEGWHVTGSARLYPSALADLVWAGMGDSLVGVCVRADVAEEAEGRNVRGRFTAMRIDDPRRVCLAGARVLSRWED